MYLKVKSALSENSAGKVSLPRSVCFVFSLQSFLGLCVVCFVWLVQTRNTAKQPETQKQTQTHETAQSSSKSADPPKAVSALCACSVSRFVLPLWGFSDSFCPRFCGWFCRRLEPVFERFSRLLFSGFVAGFSAV